MYNTIIKIPKWLNKNIFALSIVSLLDDFGYELAIAILPAFLISINCTVATFGFIVGIANAFSFLKIISGKLSDKINLRKPFTIVGYSLSCIHIFILQFACNCITVFFSWIISGIGKSIREPARNALLIESTSKQYFGRVFGFHRTFDSLGAIFGPMCALILINYLTFTYIFTIAFLISFAALLFLILFVQETKKHIQISPSFNEIKSMPSQFQLFLVSSLIFSLGNFANSLLIFRTIELLTNMGYLKAIAQKYAILFYTLYNIFYMICSYPAGHFADKFGTKKVLTLGYLLTALVSIGFMFQIKEYLIILFFLFAGIAAAITNSVSKSMIAILTHENIHGTSFGLQTTLTGFAFMLANFFVGLLWSQFSPFYGFGYSASLCLTGTILLIIFVKDE